MAKHLNKAQAKLHARIMDHKATIDNTNSIYRSSQKERADTGGFRKPGSMKR